MSFIDIQEYLGKLTCGYGEQHQNSQIIEITTDKGIEKKNRLLCWMCLQKEDGWYKRMGIINVLEAIKDKYTNIEEYRLQQINLEQQQLRVIKSSLYDFRSTLFQIFQETDNLIDQLNVELDDLNKDLQFNIIDEINKIAEEQNTKCNLIFEEFNKQLTKIKISYSEKFQNKLQNVQESYSTMVQQFTKYNSRDKERENQLIENNIQRISRIKIIRNQTLQYSNISEIQCLYCVALSFDYQCKQLAIATQENTVDIYNIENNKIEDKISTLTHENQVYSIIFSKNQDWFATGMVKGRIVIWKLLNSQWEKYTAFNAHKNAVFCLLLNQNEDHLFSCSEDQSIIIWNLDIAQNIIDKPKEINSQSGSIFSLTLNKSETRLACCSRKDIIIIWEYSKEQAQWNHKQDIKLPEFGFGYRIGFYNDYLIFQPSNKGICTVFEEKDNIFQEFQQLQLNNTESQDNVGLSPIQYNQTKDIMVLKHCQFIYFIRQQANKRFQIIGEKIQFRDNYHFSSISQDGEYLAWWNQDKKIILFKLDYE